MTNLLLASLFSFFAAPPPPSAPYDRCTLGGWQPVLEIDDRTELPDRMPTRKFQLFQNASWHYVMWSNGQLSASSGCLPDDQFDRLDDLMHELGRAPWATHRVAVACMAYSASYREFRVGGKLVYTQHMCDGFILDKNSQHALADALAFVDPMLAP